MTLLAALILWLLAGLVAALLFGGMASLNGSREMDSAYACEIAAESQRDKQRKAG